MTPTNSIWRPTGRNLERTIVLFGSIAVIACGNRGVQQLEPAEGCYRFERPLSYSATGEREAGDSSWYVIELLPGGRIDRPLMGEPRRERYAQRSEWRRGDDSLLVRLSDGLVGWDLALTRSGDVARGSATYLSDAIAVGQAPVRVSQTARRIACPHEDG